MIFPRKRGRSWRRASLVGFLFAALGFVGVVSARDIHRLDDFALFEAAAGSWEGIGISFEIAPSGRLAPAVTYRDTWEASLSEDGRLMVMNGVTRSGGRRIEYVWRFRWQPESESIRAEFENSLGEASHLEATVLADGRRLELESPTRVDDEEVGGMSLDIYLEDEDDLVIEVSLRDDKGEERYRSAARYRRGEEGEREKPEGI